jgi:adenine-specific DNA-methyltransferase
MELTKLSLLEQTDLRGMEISREVERTRKSWLGQFFTPTKIARIIAAQFQEIRGEVYLLDAGAGAGVLTAAFVERILKNPTLVRSCQLTAYEIDPLLHPILEETLRHCCESLAELGIRTAYQLIGDDFLLEGARLLSEPLFAGEVYAFTHAILNPPYGKISGTSKLKKSLESGGIDTENLYSAFVWLAMLRLKDGGEMSAITPRSFCNGRYFLPFRKALLSGVVLKNIHIFESRKDAFAEDGVLQENIIFHAHKTRAMPDTVTVTSHGGYSTGEEATVRVIPYPEVVNPNDSQYYIHITPDGIEHALKDQMESFPAALGDLDLQVSTGPVVDFRVKSALRERLARGTVPLLYPEALKLGKVVWPPAKSRKPIAIERNADTEKWLNPPGWYVLTKRFSSKEEKKRVLAGVCSPLDFQKIGFENHLNYFHRNGKGMERHLAEGLAAFLNSTLFDRYFRQFSGHTQVNATDLRKILYPKKEDLLELGKRINGGVLTQSEIDRLIKEVLPIMPKTRKAFEATDKVNEALIILKEIAAPREQQNERSALCLLALGDIRPDTDWSEAGQPLRRITDMMNWFSLHYGKTYAPNTRETVRRQTMHQFVQMGLVIENPDNPKRPINSPQWCYQLSESGVELISSYRSKNWEKARSRYLSQTKNILRERRRRLPSIPVALPDGKEIQLSAGGQNELLKDVVEKFCTRYTPGGVVLYVGDAGEKFVVNEEKEFQKLGIRIEPHGKMPDLVIHFKKKGWLVLVEAVTSHGPIDLKRHNELKDLFGKSGKGLVFVTAFPSRAEMVKYLGKISWETEVWLADSPDHLIHFNGERFLGPY